MVLVGVVCLDGVSLIMLLVCGKVEKLFEVGVGIGVVKV